VASCATCYATCAATCSSSGTGDDPTPDDWSRTSSAAFPRLHLLRFPGYAPELNPDEGIWKLAKGMLANGCPRDRSELSASLTKALHSIRQNRMNLRACIDHSGLPYFLS
jgi:hypothetical protein